MSAENEKNNREHRKDGNYSIEELVKIGDHIHHSKTAIIIADIPQGEDHNVLMTLNGKQEDVIVLIAEAMLRHEEIAKTICSAFVTYQATLQKRKEGN